MNQTVTRDHRVSRAVDRLHVRQADAESLLRFAEHLSLSDRALLRGIFQNGITATALANANGGSPSIVRARIRRLCRRITSPAFQYVVRHRLDWPERRRSIAEAVVLRGQTQRATAAALGLTVHHLRRELERIAALCEQQGASR